jgi:hypothetical protein
MGTQYSSLIFSMSLEKKLYFEMSSSFEVCFVVRIVTKEQSYDRIVRTGSFSLVHLEGLHLEKDYDVLVDALVKTKKEKGLVFQATECKKLKYFPGSIFFLTANNDLYEILEEWRLKYGVPLHNSVFFVDRDPKFNLNDIIEIQIEKVGLDRHDLNMTQNVERI